MLHEAFLGRKPSEFHFNPIIKAYITSESLFWSAWNFVTPIIAIFVANGIRGGNIESAAAGYSVYLIIRVLCELISGRYLAGSKDSKKLLTAIIGIIAVSAAYLCFALANTILSIFLAYAMAGVGMGVSSPARNSLFSIHLDKSKETTEWGTADAVQFTSMALATTLGGFIAHQYGFTVLFILAAVVNVLSVIPYSLYLKRF